LCFLIFKTGNLPLIWSLAEGVVFAITEYHEQPDQTAESL
jgi:hypothetical protein